MKISSINVVLPSRKVAFQKKKDVTGSEKQVASKTKFQKALPYILGGVATTVAIGTGLYIGSKKPKKTQEFFSSIKPKKIAQDETALLAIIALAGFGGYAHGELTKKEIDEKIALIQEGKAPNQESLNRQKRDLSEIKRTQTNSTVYKHSKYYNDVLLLTQDNVLNRNAQKYARAIDLIEKIGFEKLTSDKPLPPILKAHPTIWSVTSEFAPIKEGGLGSVPPEIRNNAEKLGVKMPTFVPMYLNDGIASISEQDGSIVYSYKGKSMPLKKLATIQMDTYKNGKSSTIPVTYYLNTQQDEMGNNRQLVFVQANDYFDGTIYEANAKTEEPEKFAVLSKAIYELAKIKTDGIKASKDVKVYDSEALETISEPDGMILNDWQASSTAALLRYKSVMENAHGQLSDGATQKLQDMRIITIGHNVMYQGSTQNNNNYHQKKATTSNILNTLFDKYAYDIVTHAKSGASSIDTEDEGLKKLDNVLLMDESDRVENYTNLLNMGIILSDYFAPVSQNYANELISTEHRDLSNMLQFALVQKAKAGKLVGIINGNDFKNLCIQTKNKKDIQKLTGLDFEEYRKEDQLEDITQARLDNKIKLYNDYILPFTQSEAIDEEKIEQAKKVNPRLEFVEGKQKTSLPILTDSELQNTPILMSGGRLVSQKGMDVLCEALEMLYKNWDEDFKGKNKPIIYIAGADGESGTQKRLIEDLKDNKLSKEDNDRVLFAHGFAPMAAMMAGSDFFLMPSKFEPCGLTQSESFALGTPVIASAVGGIVDTVNRDGKFNGILTDKDKKLDAQSYYEAIKTGLDIFYNEKDIYNKMVHDSLKEDFSWAKEGKQGPVYDYLELLGINRDSLN